MKSTGIRHRAALRPRPHGGEPRAGVDLCFGRQAHGVHANQLQVGEGIYGPRGVGFLTARADLDENPRFRHERGSFRL